MAYTKIIRAINIKKDFLSGTGETRSFEIVGTKNAVVSVEVLNEDSHYYNFTTRSFSATKSKLDRVSLSSGTYRNNIVFPKITDDDEYTIQVYAHPDFNTKMSDRLSNSSMYECVLYQFNELTLTISALSPNSITAFGGVSITTDTVKVSRGKAIGKRPFKVIVTAAATRNLSIQRQPKENDFVTFVQRTIGSAAIPIKGEDTDSASLFYKWPIDNIAGLKRGMYALGTNVTASSMFNDYYDTFNQIIPPTATTYDVKSRTVRSVEDSTYNRRAPSPVQVEDTRYDIPTRITITETLEDRVVQDRSLFEDDVSGYSDENVRVIYETYEEAIQAVGSPTISHGVVTAQTGNVVFNKQQADALKDDTIKIYGAGRDLIRSLSNYDISVNDLKVELTEVTTTTTASTIGASSTSVQITERAGIRDSNFSSVTGIGIDTSSAVPTVASGAGAVSGAGTIVLSAAQELEDGITLTFGNASRIATITGTIDIKKVGTSDTTIFLDIEKFLTAV